MDASPRSRWERLYLANVARGDESWARRQRVVRVGAVVAAVCVPVLIAAGVLTGLGADWTFWALVVVLAMSLVLVRHLWLYMGIMRGAIANEARRQASGQGAPGRT